MGPKAKPHAVFIPLPAQGHIKAMLKLAKLLHRKGFHVTFVNLEIIHRRLIESGGPNSLDGLPDFVFEFIPDGFPASEGGDLKHLGPICESILLGDFMEPFKGIITKLNHTESSHVPRVTCIVSDGYMSSFTIAAAEALGLPVALFYTFPACGFMATDQLRVLEERGLIPLKDETNGYLDQVVDDIPGMKNMRLRDFSSGIQMKSRDDLTFRINNESTVGAAKASAVIFHSFEALEPQLREAMSSMFPAVYFIGPLQLLLDQMEVNGLKTIEHTLWKEEDECLQWLDSREPNSVLYVNFGSLTMLIKEQLVEFGMGLAKSNHHFLWIIRPDMVIGDSAVLPPEFTEETKGRGFISGWCPQEKVLNHPSVGGFLVHSGWGSTIESISAGVPMLCWPFLGDQPTNCRYTCNEWGIGTEVDNNVNRNELAKLVRELMEGEKGKKLKKRAMEWKKLAEEATGPQGSSSLNLEKLIHEVLVP